MKPPDLEHLVAVLRSHAPDDVAFAQRIALVCHYLITTQDDGVAALEVVFRLRP